MHATQTSRWLRAAFGIGGKQPVSRLPTYLCPAASRHYSRSRTRLAGQLTASCSGRSVCLACQAREVHAQALSSENPLSAPTLEPTKRPVRPLPLQCSGCGALSQTADATQPGYFNLHRRAVMKYMGTLQEARYMRVEDKTVADALAAHGHDRLRKLGVDVDALIPRAPALQPAADQAKQPLCDRCHKLVNYHQGTSIFHPTVESLRETMEETPHKYNHIYHVLDAADFPMSLIPRIHDLLGLTPMRSRNRRAKDGRFYGGRQMELSFVITRSDLLAPRKDQVDTLMPYLTTCLRDALGRSGRNVRLGNVRCVSARRSWWTTELREEIWKRGGAGWMVGKVNVGKSKLFEAVFPKGRLGSDAPKTPISVPVYPPARVDASSHEEDLQEVVRSASEPLPEDGEMESGGDLPDAVSLLPPLQPETNYPEMPTVSALPGTTASPIRIPFGRGKGELVDLPGLVRCALEQYVKEEHRNSLVMKKRVIPTQQVIKPSQSLLLGGGLIRITPRTPDLVFLAYSFTPLDAHVTATSKAVDQQAEVHHIGHLENITLPGTSEKMAHAGSFQLRSDVTKRRTGPLTSKDGVKLKADRLPYRVLGLDILIEGIGWVELTAQVRTKHLLPESQNGKGSGTVDGKEVTEAKEEDPWSALEASSEKQASGKTPGHKMAASDQESAGDEPNWPEVDVYSPEGRFIGSRRTMNGWMLNRPKKAPSAKKSRPRKSMKGVRRAERSSLRA